MQVTIEAFHYWAFKAFTHVPSSRIGSIWNPERMNKRRYKAMFHLSPSMCKRLWNGLFEDNDTIPFNEVVHLLYAQHYMKTYVGGLIWLVK
jgi:hypothetical protein